MATDFPLSGGGEARAAAEEAHNTPTKTLCVPLNNNPRLFRLKTYHKNSLYNKFSLLASVRHERVCEEEVVVGRQQAVSDGCGGVVDRGLASNVLLSPGRGLDFHGPVWKSNFGRPTTSSP